MVMINISGDRLLNLLMNRFCEFTGLESDTEEYKLFKQMYQRAIADNIFESIEDFRPEVIVDNDWVNYCTVIRKDDDDYKEVKELYEKNGCCDISCETCYGFIEAANEKGDVFLVRYK